MWVFGRYIGISMVGTVKQLKTGGHLVSWWPFILQASTSFPSSFCMLAQRESGIRPCSAGPLWDEGLMDGVWWLGHTSPNRWRSFGGHNPRFLWLNNLKPPTSGFSILLYLCNFLWACNPTICPNVDWRNIQPPSIRYSPLAPKFNVNVTWSALAPMDEQKSTP